MKKLVLKNMEMKPKPQRTICPHCGTSKIVGYDFEVTLNFTSSGNFEGLSQEEISHKIYTLNNGIIFEK